MIKFIHTADVHFGMENYGKLDPETGIHTRLLDFDKAFSFCVDFAIKEEVDLFVFSGDAYKTANPTPTHQKLLFKSLLKLHQANIPIVLVVGNHDNPLSFGKAHALEVFGQIPFSGFHVFSKPEILKIDTKSGPVQIVGIPWPTRNTLSLNKYQNAAYQDITKLISAGVTSILKSLAQELDPNIPSILSAHLTVSNGIFSGSEKRAIYGTDPMFMPSQLAIEPFDYVALGHLHRFQDLNKNGYPSVVYSGSIERIDFGERKEEKGFCLVTIKEKGDTSYEFIPTPTRPFIQIEVKLNDYTDQTEQILEEIEKYNIENAVVKIVYFVPVGLKDKADLKTIQKVCSNVHYLVGIIPVRALDTRPRRNSLKVNMGLEELLDKFFDQKVIPTERKKRLLNKALQLNTLNES